QAACDVERRARARKGHPAVGQNMKALVELASGLTRSSVSPAPSAGIQADSCDSMRKGRLTAAPSIAMNCSLRIELQCARRIGKRANDVEGGAGGVSLLKGPVPQVQLQPQQHAIIGDFGVLIPVDLIVISLFKPLVRGEHRERRSRKPPLTLHAP